MRPDDWAKTVANGVVMKRKFPLLILIFAVLTTAVMLATNGPTAGDQPPSPAEPVTIPSGYMIHIDPATGQLVDRAPGTVPVVFDEALQNALSTSSEGLVEVASPVEGGGTMIDLQGRFQNTMVSTVDENGVLQAPCISGLPDSGSTDESGSGEGGDGR
jgi:hypothetical protein